MKLGASFHYLQNTSEALYWFNLILGNVLGIGGEILFSKPQSRFATSASLHWVKKRDYDRRFDHLDYDAVTGFLSAYWATPLYNFDAALHVGQYLAKDKGATLELRRTFDNGWKIGVWATQTDVLRDLVKVALIKDLL